MDVSTKVWLVVFFAALYLPPVPFLLIAVYSILFP